MARACDTGYLKYLCMKYTLFWIITVILSLPADAQQHKTTTKEKPAKQQGSQVKPANQGDDTPPKAAPPAPPKKIYEPTDGLEQMPEFSGGYPALRAYLGNNLNYPAKAIQADIQGKVIVSFTVCEDGSFCDDMVIQGLGGGCEEEALRVIKKMPRWQAGLKDGKPVKVRYILPVVFHLAD